MHPSELTDGPPWGRTEDGNPAPPSGDDLTRWVRERGSKCLVGFSRGKDSFATVAQVRAHGLEPVGYNLYTPGLDYQMRDLDRLEDALDMPIIRWPHPSILSLIGAFSLQPPDRLPAILANGIDGQPVHLLYRLLLVTMYQRGYWSPEDGEVWIAMGVRAADSPMRRIAISSHGPYNRTAHTFFPIWDWRKTDVIRALDDLAIDLPCDYKVWGSTFDGIDAKYMVMLAKHLPKDYERFKEFFPLAEAQLHRVRVGHRPADAPLDLGTDLDAWLDKEIK